MCVRAFIVATPLVPVTLTFWFGVMTLSWNIEMSTLGNSLVDGMGYSCSL